MATVSFAWQYHDAAAFPRAFRPAAAEVNGVVYTCGGWVPAADRTESLVVAATDLGTGKREEVEAGDTTPSDRAGSCCGFAASFGGWLGLSEACSCSHVQGTHALSLTTPSLWSAVRL